MGIKWKVPYFTTKFTSEQLLSYFECACIDGPFFKARAYYQELIDDLSLYLNDEYTATTISGDQGKKSREVMTSEVIYSYMVAGNVPFECDKMEHTETYGATKCRVGAQQST